MTTPTREEVSIVVDNALAVCEVALEILEHENEVGGYCVGMDYTLSSVMAEMHALVRDIKVAQNAGWVDKP